MEIMERQFHPWVELGRRSAMLALCFFKRRVVNSEIQACKWLTTLRNIYCNKKSLDEQEGENSYNFCFHFFKRSEAYNEFV